MYQSIVIGLGSMGSSTLYQLAKRGVKVMGIEQFGIGHDKGSHSGKTRIVRKAYFEHPDYVPLLEGAYKGWRDIEKLCGKKLFHPTGLVYFGNEGSEVLEGVRKSAEKYGIDIQHSISRQEYSMFSLPDDFEGVFEPDAGFALTDETIQTYVAEGVKFGAEVRSSEEVLTWKMTGDHIEVLTDKNIYQTEKLIITAGPYAQRFLARYSGNFTISRQLISWIKPKDPGRVTYGNFPCWVIDDPGYPGIFYGFPILPEDKFLGNGLLKVAHHYQGKSVNPEDLFDFNPDSEKDKIISIISKFLPDELGEIESITPCMYTNTPDEHFVLDIIPDSDSRVSIAAGFSGHGFKFVPIIGQILADLSTEGKTDWPINFLSLNRFSV